MALVSLISRQNQIIKRSLLGASSIINTSIHITNPSNIEILESASFRYFSSQEKLVVNDNHDYDDNTLVHPPNLKIHKNVISSPFYKMQIKEESEQVTDDNVSTTATTATDENDDGKSEVTTDRARDTKDKKRENNVIIYDASTQPDRKIYAIPLPERLKVPILEFATNTEVGTIHLSSHVFGQDPIREDILHRVVVYQRNKKRGKRNAKAKDRSEVRGSTRKIRAQKGTGRARAGSIRAPQRRGGGVVHGPKGNIQDYTTKLNKKVRKLGLMMAFSQKLKEGNLILVDSLALPSFKTRFFASSLENFDIGGNYGTNAFILDWVPKSTNKEQASASSGINANLLVASQNIKKTKVVRAKTANVYDILKHEKLIISLPALEAIEEMFST